MKVTINEGFVGVLTERGVFKKILQPGRYRYSPVFRNQRVSQVDARLTPQMASSSASTKDNVMISVFVYFAARVNDARLYNTVTSDPMAQVVREVNDAVSFLVATLNHQDIEQRLAATIEQITAEVNKKVTPIGLVVESISRPVVTLPKNIRNSIDAQVSAKNKALADLEEARGRTAVLRHYANTADILKGKPEVMQLMLGQKAKNIHVDFSSK